MTKTEETMTEKPTTKRDTSWDSMYEALVEYREQFGHCNVSLREEEYLSLGRWVAAQRFRKKINALSPERIQRLTDLGFVWSVSEASWEQMFAELVSIKNRLGHCNVPAKWPENPKLATWISNQRHKRKKGLLSKERIGRLNEIGFLWSAWAKSANRKKKRPELARRAADAKPIKDPPREPLPAEPPEMPVEPEAIAEDEHSEEKLYNLAPGVYVQHNDHEEHLPLELREYIEAHHGEWPPFIPLPPCRVNFIMGNPFMVERRKICWSGQGPLDPEILDFVEDNGVLPEWRPCA